MNENEEDDLRKLLIRAYERSPKKKEFFDKLNSLPGVIVSNRSHEFCRGYLACLSSKEEFLAFVIRYVGATESTSRSFLIEDATAFVEECNRAVNKEYRVLPTPEKVAVKMVLLRLYRLRKEINIYNNWAIRTESTLIQFPMIRSKSDLDKFRDSTSGIHAYSVKGVNKITLEMTSHVEFTDAVYNEAWNLFEVQGVMES